MFCSTAPVEFIKRFLPGMVFFYFSWLNIESITQQEMPVKKVRQAGSSWFDGGKMIFEMISKK